MKFLPKKCFFFVAAVLCLFSVTVIGVYAENKQNNQVIIIKAAIPSSFPPYYQLDEHGKPVGFSIEIMNAIARRSGFEIDYQPKESWQEVFDVIRAGEVDLIPDVGATSDREDFLDFSLPFATLNLSVFTRSDSKLNIRNNSQLTGIKIGVVKANYGSRIIAKDYKLAIAIQFDSFEQVLFALLSGQIDAFVYPESAAWKLATQAQQQRSIKVIGEPLVEVKRVAGVHKGDIKLLSTLNSSIKQLVSSEEYQIIYNKWFSEKPPFWTLQIISWVFAGILLLLIFIFGMWRYHTIVSLKKKLDEMVVERTQALSESEARLRGLFELSPFGIALNDYSTGDFLEINNALLAPTGYTREEFVKLSYWDITPEEYKDQEAQQLAALDKSGRYGPYEKEYIRKDGSRYPVLLNGIILNEPSGDKLIWSIVQDISDRKQFEASLIAAKNEAEHANRAKSEFLSSMSHELRTPLNAIMGFSQLLEINAVDDVTKDNAKEIVDAGNYLLELINQVLDLSKIESGHVPLLISSYNLSDLVNNCLSIINPIADSRSITIFNNVEPFRSVSVYVDKSRFKQILLNLLSNAIKYNIDNGSVTIDYLIKDNNILQLSISDTGKGLSLEQQSHLFEPFDRAGAENSGISGTGLGLVITKDLIEKMGGTIGFKSEKNKGSCFWIQVPTLKPQKQ